MAQSKYALFTVVNDDYVPGVIAMLSSFLDNNSWYKGDILVGHTNKRCTLSAKNQKILATKFKNIKFHTISEQSYTQIINKKFDSYNQRLIPALFKLEAFEIKGYDRIVFIDSDILILKNLKFLFDTKQDFVAYKDQPSKKLNNDKDGIIDYQKIPLGVKIFNIYHRRYGAIRQVLTRNTSIARFLFLAIYYPLDLLLFKYRAEYHPSHYLNTGVFSISNDFAKQHSLSKILSVGAQSFSLPLADQSVLNYYAYNEFGKITLLSNKRNGIKTKYTDENFEKLENDNPDFIHYVGKKPWSEGAEEYTYLKLTLSGRKANVVLKMDEQYTKINKLWQAVYTKSVK